MPTRQIEWNVHLLGQIAVYALLIIPVGFLAYGLARRVRMWRTGQPEDRFNHWGARLWGTITKSILHGRIVRRRNRYGGLMHLFIFVGFVTLLIGTFIVMIEDDITVPIFHYSFYRGNFYLGYKLVQHDPWAGWSFVSYALAIPLRGLSDGWLRMLHQVNWFSHFATTFAFLAYFAYSKMIHPFTSLVNVFFRRLKPMGELTPIENLEEVESFGIAHLEDFTWAQLMNLDACMHCGRCLEYCPTFNTDKPLHPRDLILEIGGYMADSGGIFSGVLGEGENSARFRWGEGPERELIGGVVSTEELWDCTTCGACMEQCPVLIEHVPLIVGMRRNLVLEQSEFPDELTNVFNNLERLSSPYQFPPNQRDAWTKKMAQPVRIMGEAAAADEEIEVLFFVGCLGSFDSRNQRTTMALARILQAAGINFAILGKEET
ncbi:MAG: (Fe-S)-binding protein, partial [Thermomicrobia bacterium]|nr:(Fe-S)-binding protein [Thermomicrobia bacterium]